MTNNIQISNLIIERKFNLIDKSILLFYALYFILNPFYLWRSGLPQIADFVLLLSFVLFIMFTRFNFSLKKDSKSVLFVGLAFVSWIIVVNSISILRLEIIDGFLLSTLFYVYNFVIFVFMFLLFNKYGINLFKITYKAIYISLVLQLIVYFFDGGFSGARATGGFNNPNQLGYYSILMASFLLFLSNKIIISTKFLVIGILVSTLLTLSSLSKAAIVSYIGLVVFYIILKSPNKRLKRKFIFVSVILSLTIGSIYSTTDIIQSNQLLSNVQRRIESIGHDTDDSLEGRGYYRIFEYPEYWLFGAGEGDFSRFRFQRMEFHSTLGNIQVSYGLIGSTLFIIFMFIALKKDRFQSWYIVFFLMSYGLTHNGIRNTLLWILFAFMASGINGLEVKKCRI